VAYVTEHVGQSACLSVCLSVVCLQSVLWQND